MIINSINSTETTLHTFQNKRRCPTPNAVAAIIANQATPVVNSVRARGAVLTLNFAQNRNPNEKIPFNVDRNILATNPSQVLNDLCDILRQYPKAIATQKIGVSFSKDGEKEKAGDGGGLLMELVSLLAKRLPEMIDRIEGFPTTSLGGKDNSTVLRNIGTLLDACHKDSRLTLGRVFPTRFFELLQNPNLCDDDILALGEALTESPDKKELFQIALGTKIPSASEYKSIDDLGIIEEPATQAKVREYLLAEQASIINAARTISSCVTQEWSIDSPNDLDVKIQGAFFDRTIIANAIASKTKDANQVIWIKDFINNAPQQDVENFLFAVTANSCLSAGSEITIKMVDSSTSLMAHTCFATLDVSDNLETAPTSFLLLPEDARQVILEKVTQHPEEARVFLKNLYAFVSVAPKSEFLD